MANLYKLLARTDLSKQEVHKILFKDIAIIVEERRIKLGEGWYCNAEIFPDTTSADSYVLDVPENLVVIFSFRWNVDGYIKAMEVIMNWITHTNTDFVFLENSEIILLSRINGEVVINSSEKAGLPQEVIDMIDIEYQVRDLGIL